MRKEIISSDGILDLVKFSLSPRQRLRRLRNLLPDLLSPRFWDGEKIGYDPISIRLEVFMDDLKAIILGYWCGYQGSLKWYEYLDWNEFDMEHIMQLPEEAKKYALEYRNRSLSESTKGGKE